MFGLLNIDKPQGKSSRDVVNHVQRLVRPAKVGHAGTLDPIATGVLIVCVGPATKLIEYVQQMPKHYHGTFLLGRESASEDIESDVRELNNPPVPTTSDIEAVLPKFRGTIQQVPPAFSALKVKGKRAYKLARKGETVQLEPRSIDIYDLQVVAYEYPKLELDIRCGSGTYVRSLGRDIARALGTEAVMSALERTAVGQFRVRNSADVSELTETSMHDHRIHPIHAVPNLRRVELSGEYLEKIRNGVFVPNMLGNVEGEIAGCDSDGELTCLLTVQGEQLRPLRNFVDGRPTRS